MRAVDETAAGTPPGGATPLAAATTLAGPTTLAAGPDRPPSILILSAGVGRGHHAAAEGLREDFARTTPDARVSVRNGIGESRGTLRVLLEHCLRWQLMTWPRAYSISYAVSVRWSLGRRLALRMLHRNTRRRLEGLIATERPDVVVSTYPGVTAALGVMRRQNTVTVPVCAMITDIAGLHFWAHPGVDLHLVAYPESLGEVAQVTGGAAARVARPPLTACHLERAGRDACRASLGVGADDPLVVISGGGWGVGDLTGAVGAALAIERAAVIAVCGENSGARRRLSRRYADEPRVRVLGDTRSMAELLGAADALVHSTGGVTCLEAAAHGCPVIAYGFGFGHVRQNVATMARLGLVRAARSRSELVRELAEAVRSPPVDPPEETRDPPSSAILGLVGQGGLTASPRPRGGRDGARDEQAAAAAGRRGLVQVAAILLALAVPCAVWLVWRPPSPDLAAQVYRAHLFATGGFTIWDNAWYGGHYLPGYSLIFPPLASVLGVRWTGVIAVACSTVIFSRLAGLLDGFRTRPATMLFGLSAIGDLFIGRVTFALGVTMGLACLLAAARGSRFACGLFSLACAAASPVAAAFLVMAACADLSVSRAVSRAALIAGPALCLVLALVVLFPEGGYEPFALTSLLAAAGATAAICALLPPGDRLLRRLALLYLAGLVLAYVVRSPMGSNAVRFGVLFAPAALAGRITVADVERTYLRVRSAIGRRRSIGRPPLIAGRIPATAVLALLGAAIVLWQVTGPIDQSVGAAVDPAAHYSFYLPAIRYLEDHGAPQTMRIEVPFTSSHWDATILGRRFLLARGWERQLDTRYDGLFYAPVLTASAYHAWLLDNAVRFVALSSAPPDFSSVQEDALIRGGLPFLHLVFETAQWRIYAVAAAVPLATGPGSLASVDTDGFTLHAVRPGTFTVRVHYTPYWTTTAGQASVSQAPGGWTRVVVSRPGSVTIDAELRSALHL